MASLEDCGLIIALVFIQLFLSAHFSSLRKKSPLKSFQIGILSIPLVGTGNLIVTSFLK
jgi:hypothetical protein